MAGWRRARHAPEQISRPGYDAVTLGRCAIVNRIQALVLSFFLVVWVSLVAILVAAPEVYDQALRLRRAATVRWRSPF